MMRIPTPRAGEPLGLIAGSGELPLHFAREAKRRGHPLFIAGVLGEAAPSMKRLGTETKFMSVGQLGGLISFFRRNGVKKAVMEGQVRHAHLFKNLRLDFRAAALLFRMKDRSGEAIMKAVAEELHKSGTDLMDCRNFLEDLVAQEGCLTRTRPRGEALSDIPFGLEMARLFAAKAVGQTLVARKKAVVAVEAVEGTNAAILRGGKLAGPGTVVVKTASPHHDWRFDVPTIGPATIRTLIRAKAAGLVMESGAAFLLQKKKTLALADRYGIFLQVVKRTSS